VAHAQFLSSAAHQSSTLLVTLLSPVLHFAISPLLPEGRAGII